MAKLIDPAAPGQCVGSFIFDEIKRNGRRGRFPMRRGGPYLSARVDKVRGNNTEAAHCSSSHTLRPRPRGGSTEGGGVACHSGESGAAGAGGDQKMWIEGSNRRNCRYSAVSIHPTKNCVLLFRKKGVGSLVWIDLLRLELRHVSALCSALRLELYGREIMFSALPPTFSLYNCELCLSPLPFPRDAAGGRRDHCLNTSPVKQDLVFDTRLQGDRPAEGKGMTRIGGLHNNRIGFNT